MSAFAQAIREATFSQRNRGELVEGTVNASLSYVAQAFRADNRPDPRLDIDGKLCFLLQEQFRGYRNQDGTKNKQKALPMKVLRKMHELSTTDRDKAIAWLSIGAIFFAMRSCEYLRTAAEETKRTKMIRVGNITFKKNGKVLSHSHPELHKSDMVKIRFTYQKNDRRDVCIHMFASGDKVLCPVKAWAYTVKRVRSIPDADDDSPVCLFMDSNGNSTLLTSDYARSRLRAIVDIMGKEDLGFTKEEIGLHSIRSGGAMAMFLSGTSVIVIQRVGRWSSEAFLEYIRDQVESFTAGVSKKMLACEEFFDMTNDNTAPHATQNRSDPNDLIEESEDGLDSVPFGIRFSNLALEPRKRKGVKK